MSSKQVFPVCSPPVPLRACSHFLYQTYKESEPDRRLLSDVLRYVTAFQTFIDRPENGPRYVQGRRRYILKKIDRLQSPALKTLLMEALK